MRKLLTLLVCIAYVIWPLDLVPDFVPIVGWADDLVAIVVGMSQLLADDDRSVK